MKIALMGLLPRQANRLVARLQEAFPDVEFVYGQAQDGHRHTMSAAQGADVVVCSRFVRHEMSNRLRALAPRFYFVEGSEGAMVRTVEEALRVPSSPVRSAAGCRAAGRTSARRS